MDAHFNSYKARYELLDTHVRFIQQTQYIRDMDIFINLDDIIHNGDPFCSQSGDTKRGSRPQVRSADSRS